MQSQFRWICCWPCFRWAIRSYSWGRILNDDWTKIVNNCQTIVITLHRFKVIKYYWEARDQRTKSVLLVLPPDTTQNNLTSIIHHLQTCHFLWFFILCATEFQGAHLTCSHVNLSAFLKHHSKYLQVNEKIELCGVARAFVQISENGPRSKKLGPCWLAIYWREKRSCLRVGTKKTIFIFIRERSNWSTRRGGVKSGTKKNAERFGLFFLRRNAKKNKGNGIEIFFPTRKKESTWWTNDFLGALNEKGGVVFVFKERFSARATFGGRRTWCRRPKRLW